MIPEISNGLFREWNAKLHKWPVMLTSGERVTIEQAKEIIRRTDSFLIRGYGGNDHSFNRRLASRLRMPHYNDHSVTPELTFDQQLDLREKWHTAWSVIEPHYVNNDWISTSYAGGPNGWCWPTGQISYTEHVGKWPTIEEVLEDWTNLAKAFPFLDLAATLMSETDSPIATILVSEGRAKAVAGSCSYHDKYPPIVFRDYDKEPHDFSYEAEHGLPAIWFYEWEIMAQNLSGLAE